MSRADRIVNRRQEGRRNGTATKRKTIHLPNGKAVTVLPTTHIQGNNWWRSRFADLVDRKNTDGTVTPRAKAVLPTITPSKPEPERLPRPEGMTRQMHRRLYRVACVVGGVPYDGIMGPRDKRDSRLARKALRDLQHSRASLNGNSPPCG